MIKGFPIFVLAYGLSQFYRACLAVFAPVLKTDIGLGPEQISSALGVWFLAFAAMQIPVGWLLDHWSPKATASVLLIVGGGLGAIVFSFAQGPTAVSVAMGLIGIGCSPVLMAGLYIVARSAPPARFGTLVGLILGLGSLGNVAASVPLTFSLNLIGWRATLWVLAILAGFIAFLFYRFVNDPPRLKPSDGAGKGLRDLLRLKSLYPIFLIAMVAYAPGAGLRGSWIGSYLTDVFGASPAQIGTATLCMAFAMIGGALAFGPIDRLIRSYKWIVGGSAAITFIAACCLWLGLGETSIVGSVVLFAFVGFFASNYPQIMNHGRSVIPPELVGRGVTLINLFSIGGVGLSQMVTARLFASGAASSGYSMVFGYYALSLVVGGSVYLLFARDPR
ncbi:MFS transporter [Celeribacter litoreus]|uniref:MFS transporter n=1 Tax=Celeribacter litoreus TaxID=2876714 RepID=UPI001CCE29B1|nr:MFS transporter [Celeribacter litoreus]MCA0042260.1 MFS transporter [Celeribacter litoreus]